MNTSYDLERFVHAQDAVYEQVLEELRAGSKRSHWIWFVFPQIAGLGRSETAKHYAISSREEAVAYLAHPLLGPRLEQCTKLVLAIEGKSLNAIFGNPDDVKFCSCMTLFANVAGPASIYQTSLEKYCNNQADPNTIARLTE